MFLCSDARYELKNNIIEIKFKTALRGEEGSKLTN